MTAPQQSAGARWVTNWIYGMDTFPSAEDTTALLKAVFISAKGDGVISQEERDFAFGYFDAVGVPSSLHDLIKNYQGEDNLEDLLKNSSAINEGTKRAILYTAIIVSGADGYADAEHAKVVEFAGRLGVEKTVADQIRDLYLADQKQREARIALLFPGEHPWANKK